MQWDLHASGEVSEEAAHSFGLDVSETGGVEMIESGLEVSSHIVISSLTGESEMGSEDLIAWWLCVLWLENELASFLTCGSRRFSGVLAIHGPHELVTAGTLDVELGWKGSLIGSEMLSSGKVVPTCWETWMRAVCIPDSGDTTVVGLKCHGRDSSDESQDR